jgi:glucokinase-like ROK family protein
MESSHHPSNNPGAVRQNRLQTGDQSLVRQINLSIILDQLRQNAPLSRAALAEKTGLNKTTVSSLVSELIDQQLVCEIGLESVGIGRPSVQLTLNPKAGFVVSAEIGVDFISIIATDFTPHTIYQLKKTIDPNQDQQEIIHQVLVLLRQVVAHCRGGSENSSNDGPDHSLDSRLLGLAVGVPGLVDYATGTILFAPNLHWKDAPLGEILRKEYSVPVFVDNEANMAALGEFYFGAAHGYPEVLYISAGVGIGGGLVLDGKVIRGQAGFAGEFGHMTMNPEGALCSCGNRGCWETQASQRALFALIRDAIAAGHKSQLSDLLHGNLNALTVEYVLTAARAGDALSIQSLQKIGCYLGIGIASLTNALNPDLIVLGGPISLAWEFIQPVIEAEILKRTLKWHRENARLALARYGADACVMGGVAAVYNQILAYPNGRTSPVSLPVS